MVLSLFGSIALLSGAAISSDPSLSSVAASGEPTAPIVMGVASDFESDRLLLG